MNVLCNKIRKGIQRCQLDIFEYFFQKKLCSVRLFADNELTAKTAFREQLREICYTFKEWFAQLSKEWRHLFVTILSES